VRPFTSIMMALRLLGFWQLTGEDLKETRREKKLTYSLVIVTLIP
jgi:hypothetical protein